MPDGVAPTGSENGDRSTVRSSDVRYLDVPFLTDLAKGLTADEHEAVAYFNSQVTAHADLGDILDFLLQATEKIIPTDRISLAFVEEGGKRLVTRFVRARYQSVHLAVGAASDLTHSSLMPVVQARQPLIINDLQAYARENPHASSARMLLKEGIQATMSCPLVAGDHTLGVVIRGSRKTGAFGERHVLISRALGEHLARAAEHAYHIEQLKKANDAYREMLTFVAHELKSPLTSMVSTGRILSGGYLGEMADSQRERVERMTAKGEYLLGLIDDYLNLAWIESGDLRIRLEPKVNLKIVVERALDLLQPQLDSKQIQFKSIFAGDSSSCGCDSNLIQIVLVNLLSNAIKYGHQAGHVEVHVSCEPERLNISVFNEGPGFSEEEKLRLFQRFYRLQSPILARRKGTGVGLYVCWRIVQQHGGHIWADSHPGKWALFSFEIPQPPVACTSPDPSDPGRECRAAD